MAEYDVEGLEFELPRLSPAPDGSNRSSRRNKFVYMAELEAVVQIVRLRQYQNILTQNIESMKKDGIVKNPIPLRENFMPVYTANLAKIGLLPHPVPSNLATPILSL